jgi:hypothetical protein
LANAAEKAFADRAILLDENLLLFEQNNGKAKVLSYEDIVEAQRQCDMKEAILTLSAVAVGQSVNRHLKFLGRGHVVKN